LGTLRQMSKYPSVLGVAAAMFLWQLAHQALPNTWTYYTIEKFGWSPAAIGSSLAFAGVAMMLMQGVLAGVLIPPLGEARAVVLGLSIGGLGFVGYALATEGWMMYPCIAISSLSGLAFPSMNAIMSKQAPPTAQGELQGGVASIYSLTAIIAPVLMTQIFSYF